MIKKTIFLFVCSLFVIRMPLCAVPSIFEAMSAFEAGDDDRARTLFRPFLKGTPVARPYCERLMPGELPPQEDVFRGRTSPLIEDAKGWFTVSLALRQLNESRDDSEKESAYRKLLKIYKNQKLPAAGYACSHLAESLNGSHHTPADEMFLTEFIMARTTLPRTDLRRLLSDPSQKSSFLKPAIEAGHCLGMGIDDLSKGGKIKNLSDPRSYLAFVNIPRLRISFDNDTDLVDLVPRLKVLQMQLAKKTESDSFYDLAKLFTSQKIPALASQFIFMASLFGSSNSQLTMANDEVSTDKKLYWVSQGAEKEDVWALEKAVEAFKDAPLRQILYLKRLLQAGELRHIDKYFEILKANDRLEEAAAIVTLMLDHEDKLILGVTAFRFMKIFVELPREATASYLIPMFNYLKKHKVAMSYLVRGTLLAETAFESPFIDEEFSGDYYQHFAKTEELGEPGGAYHFGFYKEKEGKVEEALEAYERAIIKGHTMAAGRAGGILMEKGSPETDAKAFQYLKMAYSHQNCTPYDAYNLAMLHIYERGGAPQESAKIHECLDRAMLDPDLRDAAAFEKGLYMYRSSGDIQGLYFILLGVENDYPESLISAGQILLLNKLKLRVEQKQYGLDCIKRAMSVQAPGAKVIYALLLLSGIEDLLERNQEEAQKLIATFNEQEQQNYLEALEMLKAELTTEEDSSPTVVEAQPEPKKEKESEVEVEEPAEVKTVEEKKPSAPELSSTEIRIQRLHAEIEELMGKKQVKWRKVQSLMGKLINLTSGSFSPATGGGSGHHGKVNDVPIHLHIAHGKGHNPTELTGGRLEAVLKSLKEASQPEPVAKGKKKEKKK